MFTNCYRFYIYIYSHFAKSGPLRNDRIFKVSQQIIHFQKHKQSSTSSHKNKGNSMDQ